MPTFSTVARAGPAQPPALPTTPEAPDPQDRAHQAARGLDNALHALAARFTSGLSPISLALAQADWLMHLATQPAQSLQLALDAQRGAIEWWQNSLTQQGNGLADGEDLRFSDLAWQQWPYAPVVRAYRGAENWWRDATRLRGMAPHHQEMARVFARQWLDTVSPANAGLANPEVLRRTLQQSGRNLVSGLAHAVDDSRLALGLSPLQAPPRSPLQSPPQSPPHSPPAAEVGGAQRPYSPVWTWPSRPVAWSTAMR